MVSAGAIGNTSDNIIDDRIDLVSFDDIFMVSAGNKFVMDRTAVDVHVGGSCSV